MAALQGKSGIVAEPLSRRTLRAVVVNYNTGPWLERCIDALLASSIRPQVCVVDNGSTDSSLAAIADKPVQVLSNPINRGFGAACNQGAENLADEQWVVFVNPDCEVEPNCLEIMSQAISEHSGVGMAGAWVMNTDGSVQSATRRHLPTVRRTLRSLFRRPSGAAFDC